MHRFDGESWGDIPVNDVVELRRDPLKYQISKVNEQFGSVADRMPDRPTDRLLPYGVVAVDQAIICNWMRVAWIVGRSFIDEVLHGGWEISPACDRGAFTEQHVFVAAVYSRVCGCLVDPFAWRIGCKKR